TDDTGPREVLQLRVGRLSVEIRRVKFRPAVTAQDASLAARERLIEFIEANHGAGGQRASKMQAEKLAFLVGTLAELIDQRTEVTLVAQRVAFIAPVELARVDVLDHR